MVWTNVHWKIFWTFVSQCEAATCCMCINVAKNSQMNDSFDLILLVDCKYLGTLKKLPSCRNCPELHIAPNNLNNISLNIMTWSLKLGMKQNPPLFFFFPVTLISHHILSPVWQLLFFLSTCCTSVVMMPLLIIKQSRHIWMQTWRTTRRTSVQWPAYTRCTSGVTVKQLSAKYVRLLWVGFFLQ